MLSLLSGHEDIVVGAPTANRRRGDVGGLIGFFANTLAVRADLSGSPTVEDALKRVSLRLREGLAHVDLPFERVVELVNPPRSPAYTALFQTMVAWVPPCGRNSNSPARRSRCARTTRTFPQNWTWYWSSPTRAGAWSAGSNTPSPSSRGRPQSGTHTSCCGCSG
ncbi:condensation domain-containing protein [Streptomyces sp. M10(2022)]